MWRPPASSQLSTAVDWAEGTPNSWSNCAGVRNWWYSGLEGSLSSEESWASPAVFGR